MALVSWNVGWKPLAAIGAAAAMLALHATSGAQAQRTVSVTVLDGAGRPVAGANVCAGSSSASRGDLGSARTDANGRATMAVSAPQSGSPVASSVVTITASTSTVGGAVVTPLAAIVVRTTPNGPRCPAAAISGSLVRPDTRTIRQNLPAPTGGFTPVRINLGKRCLGAAGMNCGDVAGEVSTCANGECTINRGSWEHDECCVANPDGGMCDGKFEELITAQGIDGGPPQVCQAEFNMAFTRLNGPFSWRRPVNFATRNTTGTVVRAEYCARQGDFVPAGEQRFCCSQAAATLSPVDVARFLARPGATAAMIGGARVCT